MGKWIVVALAAAAVVGIGLVTWSAVSSSQREQAYLAQLQGLSGVAYAQYEMQHPGVPWNNDLVVMAAIDFTDEAAAADLIEQLVEVSVFAGLRDHYTTTVYLVDSSSKSESQYTNRRSYFGSQWLPDGIIERLGDRYKVFYSGVSPAVGY